MSDIKIARAANKKPILEIGGKLGIPTEHLLPFGHDKAKVSEEFIKSLSRNKDGNLILVTAINPTPAGEGKTTTTVGLGDGLNAIGKKAAVCIREASLGPCFGMKGGAAGGGGLETVWMTTPAWTDGAVATGALSAAPATAVSQSAGGNVSGVLRPADGVRSAGAADRASSSGR